MGSSDRRPIRILWGSFSDTVLSLVDSREEFDAACRKKNIEVIHWCHGRHLTNTLHFTFPLRYSDSAYKPDEVWVSKYQSRFSDLPQIEDVVAYVSDNFSLICESFKPDIFVSWNKYDPVFGYPYVLAKAMGIATFDMERALLPHLVSLGLDFKRTAGDLPQGDLKKGRELLARHTSAHLRPQRMPHFSVSSGSKPTLLIYGSWDAVTDRSVHLYPSSHEMASRIAEDLPGWKVIYKPHPLAEKTGSKINNLIVSSTNPVSLLKDCDAVLTNGTKLELDVIQNGKPLILAGGGFLANSSAAYLALSHEAAIEAINTINQWHSPENAFDSLAGFVASKTTTSWYALTNKTNEALPLDSLLDIFLEAVTEPAVKDCMQSSILNYHAISMKRYHRSGKQDIANWELLAELTKRIKAKLRRF